MARERKVYGNVLFSESQRFRVKWLWALIIGCILFSLLLPFIMAWVNKEEFREAVFSLLITVPLETIIVYLMYTVRLEIIVSTEGIFYRWPPFSGKYNFIRKNDIADSTADNGPALSYGVHYVWGYGWVHNTGPGKGMRFNLSNGKKIFIGTNNINAFQSAVDKMKKGKI